MEMTLIRRFFVPMTLIMELAFGAVSPPAEAMSGPPPEAAFYRAEALARIAIVQVEQGDTAGAIETITLAQESAQATMDKKDRQRVAVLIAKAQALAGDAASALNTARSIPEETLERYLALCLVARILVGSGHALAADRAIALAYDELAATPNSFGAALVSWVEALRGESNALRAWAESNPNLEIRVAGLLAMAAALADAGDAINAKNVLQRLFENLHTDEAVFRRFSNDIFGALTVWAQARAGDVSGARHTASRIPSRDNRIRALIYLAAAQAARGDARGARETIDLAAIGDRSWLGLQVEAVTEDLAERVYLDEARGVHVYRVIKGSPADQAGMMKGDVILLFNSQPIPDQAVFTRLYEALTPGSVVNAEVLRHGRRVPVVLTLGENPSPVRVFPEVRAELAGETTVAVGQASAGNMSSAIGTIRQMANPADRILAWSILAAARAAVGDLEGARRVASIAREAAETIPDSISRRSMMATVALARMEAGDPAGALESLAQAPDLGPVFQGPVWWGRFLTGDLEGPAVWYSTTFILRFWLFREDRPLKPAVIAEWKAKAGDLAGALAAAMDITDSSDRTGP